MIKYLEPREFYCAVITAFIGPFSLCLRGPLCLLSAQAEMVPAPSAGGLFMGSEDIWNMWWGWKGERAAWLEGQRPPWAPAAMEEDGDLTWRDLEHIQLQKHFRFLENMHKSEEGKRETQPGTGKALDSASLHRWALFFLRAVSLTPQGSFCAGKSKVKQVPWSRKVWWELKTFLHKWRGYSPVPMEHSEGLGSLRGKKNIYRVEKAKKWRFGDFGWLRRCVAPQILQDLTTTSLCKEHRLQINARGIQGVLWLCTGSYTRVKSAPAAHDHQGIRDNEEKGLWIH